MVMGALHGVRTVVLKAVRVATMTLPAVTLRTCVAAPIAMLEMSTSNASRKLAGRSAIASTRNSSCTVVNAAAKRTKGKGRRVRHGLSRHGSGLAYV
eukprot:3681448-Pyramimonas_sp.AAC.2